MADSQDLPALGRAAGGVLREAVAYVCSARKRQ